MGKGVFNEKTNNNMLSQTGDPISPSSYLQSSSKTKQTLRSEFMKGIKRDMSLFPVLKDEKYWDSWNSSFNAIARTQGVADVLDIDYSPDDFDSDEQDLFQAKQEYMFTVFQRALQISQGKSLVRKHEKDYDAQTLYKDLYIK